MQRTSDKLNRRRSLRNCAPLKRVSPGGRFAIRGYRATKAAAAFRRTYRGPHEIQQLFPDVKLFVPNAAQRKTTLFVSPLDRTRLKEDDRNHRHVSCPIKESVNGRCSFQKIIRTPNCAANGIPTVVPGPKKSPSPPAGIPNCFALLIGSIAVHPLFTHTSVTLPAWA